MLLERHAEGYADLLDDTSAQYSRSELAARLEWWVNAGKVSSALIIEELLRSPYDDGHAAVPDIKLYCFYGTVGLIMTLRRTTRAALTCRFFALDGADLGAARLDRDHDPTLPEPIHLKHLVAAGETLSAALPEPFVRLDFYEQLDGIVFGEVSPVPGGKQMFRSDIDERLGSLWEDAEARLRVATVQRRNSPADLRRLGPTADPDGQLMLANSGFRPPV
jgi:hypothetical protein